MARILIVGCGCRGQSLAREFVAAGHVVRGTTRDRARAGAIAEAGAEPFVADPDRIATLMPALEGVAAVVWLLAGATGNAEKVAALHGPRLRFFLEKIVDTGVRAFAYELPASGPSGRSLVAEAAATWQIPVTLLDTRFHEGEVAESAWAAAARVGIESLLGVHPAAADALR